MTKWLDEYKRKLLNEILVATSQDDVKRFVDLTVRDLQEQKVDADIISGFFDKINSDLALLNPITKDAQQWSNIKMAIILFNRFRSQMNATIN